MPSDEDIAEACTMPLHQVPAFLESLVGRGILEIEPAGQGERRMRVQLGS